ncbi:conserved phage C-terminal domain-containing protein [Latilactobacillus sakei]
MQARYIGITSYPSQEKLATPSKENLPVNTTSFNTTVNNTNNIKPLSGKPDPIPYDEIISYLNQVTSKSFKNVETHKKLIRARWNEKATLGDFKKVIDNKSSEWLGTDMAKYLQPSTLFGNKFDQYLNQTNTVKQKGDSYGGIEF